MIENKKKAKEIVVRLLERLRLKPCASIDKALNDPTVRAYLGAVQDQKGKKYFLKVRVQEIETEKRFFWKTYVFSQIFKNHPQLAFNQKTPRLLDSSFGQEIDYFLWELIKGKDLGTRAYYDIIRLKMDEIDEVLSILKSFLEIPVKVFPKNYDYRGRAYFKKKLSDCLKLGIRKYFSSQEINQFKKIANHPLLDKYQRFFSHGDFKPNNFIRTKKGLYVVDFETSSISNQFFDFFSIWGYAIRKPRWRAKLMEKFLAWYQFKSREERTLFGIVKILFLMRELGSLLYYFKRNLTQRGIKVAKRYLPQRIGELKEAL